VRPQGHVDGVAGVMVRPRGVRGRRAPGATPAPSVGAPAPPRARRGKRELLLMKPKKIRRRDGAIEPAQSFESKPGFKIAFFSVASR